MTTMELFLKLVREALWRTEEGLPEELSANMAANILRGGREQGLSGLVIDALVRNKVRMPDEQRLEGMVTLMKVRQSHEEAKEGLRRLIELFDERGISYVVVKGLAVGAYYPDPTLRIAGDIDYYCDEKNFPKAKAAVREAWGIDDSRDVDDHHVHYEFKGIDYEGHFILTSFYSKRINRYWQQIVDEESLTPNPSPKGEGKNDGSGRLCVNVDGMAVRTLSPTLHALFVFIHLFSHLLKQGISLRQFCDLAVMLHYCRNEIDRERQHEILRALGLERAFRTIGCILTENLGLSKEDLGYELTDRDRRFAKRVFDIVRYRGNMGHSNLLFSDIGWKHRVELFVIKIIHFMKLWPLAPAYSCRWIAYELTKKVRRR